MTAKIITILFVIALVICLGIIYKDSDIVKKGKRLRGNPFSSPELAKGPTVYIRLEEGKKYQAYTVRKSVFTIGRAEKSDLCIDAPFIANKQAEIRRKQDEEGVYFVFINLGKHNTEYLDQSESKGKWKWMGYKDQVVLGEKEGFYFGDIKLLIETPELLHPVRKSDREILQKEQKTPERTSERSCDEEWYDI